MSSFFVWGESYYVFSHFNGNYLLPGHEGTQIEPAIPLRSLSFEYLDYGMQNRLLFYIIYISLLWLSYMTCFLSGDDPEFYLKETRRHLQKFTQELEAS